MAAHPAAPSLGFSRQERWSGLPFPSPMHESEKWKGSRSVVSNSSQPHGLQPTRLLHPWDFPGKSTGVGAIAFSDIGVKRYTKHPVKMGTILGVLDRKTSVLRTAVIKQLSSPVHGKVFDQDGCLKFFQLWVVLYGICLFFLPEFLSLPVNCIWPWYYLPSLAPNTI